MRPEEAGPAADALFDLFQFVFSPLGVGAVVGVFALAYAWDLFSASQGRTLLGGEYQERVREMYTVRFSVDDDGFYESPSGGVEKVERGVQYLEEFTTYDSCITLAKALQREFGKSKVQYQTFKTSSDRPGDYTPKKGEKPGETLPGKGSQDGQGRQLAGSVTGGGGGGQQVRGQGRG